MAARFEASNVVQNRNSLELDLLFLDERRNVSDMCILDSPDFLISGIGVFKAKAMASSSKLMYFVQFTPNRDSDRLSYTLDYSHKIDYNDNERIEQSYIKNNLMQLVGEYIGYRCTFNFYVSVTLTVSTRMDPYATCVSLHNDTDLTDFELRGVDGSVELHKAVAAAFSPVMKTAFTGDWGKKVECVIDAPPNTAKETLQHLKDYMYLDTVPETDVGLKELLLLASLYMMHDLELRCSIELLSDVTPEKAYYLFEFAMKHQMSELMFEIMQRTETGLLKVAQIREMQKW